MPWWTGGAGESCGTCGFSISTRKGLPYADPEFEGIFQLESFFVGGNVRKQTQAGYADYIPVFLHETQRLIRKGT